jgi:hypothetical protein
LLFKTLSVQNTRLQEHHGNSGFNAYTVTPSYKIEMFGFSFFITLPGNYIWAVRFQSFCSINQFKTPGLFQRITYFMERTTIC